jgi:hypothetical protein
MFRQQIDVRQILRTAGGALVFDEVIQADHGHEVIAVCRLGARRPCILKRDIVNAGDEIDAIRSGRQAE